MRHFVQLAPIIVVVGIVLILLNVVNIIARNKMLKTSPETSQTIQPEYPFQAKLISQPDHSKQMQWKAVPLTDRWKDTIFVDFDHGGGMDFNFREGDVVNLIGVEADNGEWLYRHDDQYWMRERHQRYLRQR